MSATPIDIFADEGNGYLRDVSMVIRDVRNGRIHLDFPYLGIELDKFIHIFRFMERMHTGNCFG